MDKKILSGSLLWKKVPQNGLWYPLSVRVLDVLELLCACVALEARTRNRRIETGTKKVSS